MIKKQRSIVTPIIAHQECHGAKHIAVAIEYDIQVVFSLCRFDFHTEGVVIKDGVDMLFCHLGFIVIALSQLYCYCGISAFLSLHCLGFLLVASSRLSCHCVIWS
jgi:hypothetical protein